MIKANKIKLGLFFSTAISMIIFGFIVIGSMKIFQPTLSALTVINSTVEGLSIGSPVKYKGVLVGQISKISLRNTDGYINVYFKVLPSSVDEIDKDGTPSLSQEKNNLINLLQSKRVGCRINTAGIMGGGFLELTLADDQKWAIPDLKITPPDETIYVKSVSSHVPDAIQNLSNTLEEISKIDFVKLADKVDNMLDEADKVFNNTEVTQMLTRFNRISIQLEGNLTSLQKMFTPESGDKLKSIVDNLDAATKNFNSSLPPEKMQQMVDNIDYNLKALKELLVNTDQTRAQMVKMISDLRYQLDNSLLNMNHTLKSISDLSNSINDNPEQIIRGKNSKKAY